MDDVDHGAWNRYTPTTFPPGAPPNALYAQNASGVDWYAYVKGGNFELASVKFVTYERDSLLIVGAATKDQTMLFPAGGHVYETFNYTGNDPQGDLGNKVYDPTTGVFTPQQPVEQPPLPAEEVLYDHEARIRTLEGTPAVSKADFIRNMRKKRT